MELLIITRATVLPAGALVRLFFVFVGYVNCQFAYSRGQQHHSLKYLYHVMPVLNH